MARSIGGLVVLAACGAGDGAPADGSTAPSSDQSSEPFEAIPCDTSDCVQDGVHLFDGAGSSRELYVTLPDDPVGAPVLFVWHHLTGTPEEVLWLMPLDQAADDGYIVVVPRSRGVFLTEWDVSSGPEGNEDIQLFDAVLDDLIARYDAEPHAFTTGFSAGGLFTTWLTLQRSERLAASAPFSGGTPPESYRTPADDIPVMLSWGGTTDTVPGFDFDAASRYAASALADDGHPVWTCVHDLGHWVPDDATTRTRAFFEAVRYGDDISLPACDAVD